jgi:hypothetical protein
VTYETGENTVKDYFEVLLKPPGNSRKFFNQDSQQSGHDSNQQLPNTQLNQSAQSLALQNNFQNIFLPQSRNYTLIESNHHNVTIKEANKQTQTF